MAFTIAEFLYGLRKKKWSILPPSIAHLSGVSLTHMCVHGFLQACEDYGALLLLLFFFFGKWRSACMRLLQPFRTRISSYWLSKLRQLWTNIPWRVACELLSLMLCLNSIVSPMGLYWVKGVCMFCCNLPSALLAEWGFFQALLRYLRGETHTEIPGAVT